MKTFVKSLDEVEEQFRGLYVQVKGGFELKLEGTEQHSAFGQINGQLETLKNKFKDVDPAKYAELVKAEQEFNQLQAKITEATESVTKQLTTQFNTEKDRLTGEVKELEEALHDALVVSAATSAIAQVAPDNVELLLPHVVKQMKVVKNKDGKREAVILDEKGQPRVVNTKEGVKSFSLWEPDVEGADPTPSLLREMRENKKFMGAFPDANKGGGGAEANTGAAGGAALGGGAAAGGKTVKIPRSLAQTNFAAYKQQSEAAKKEGATIELTE
ncbi:MAG TPA: hypothetical protein VF668_01160 [Pyrinomonadaceae bacterium]|jgi:hypothetical protein